MASLRAMTAAFLAAAALTSFASIHADSYSFTRRRTAYQLNVTATGTAVVDSSDNSTTLVPFGEKMTFNGEAKYSKNTVAILHHVQSHLEAYQEWQLLVDLPVDFLRAAAYWIYKGQHWGEDQLNGEPYILPDRGDKVIVSYINALEFTAIGKWDPSFNPEWDRNDDALIDEGIRGLPDYVDLKAFNTPWKNYVAAYWTESWRRQLARKIDVAAAEHFDGIMLDAMTSYYVWAGAYPSMNFGRLRNDAAEVIRWASLYAKRTYGSGFVVTANLDPGVFEYFSNIGGYLDAGYYQNALFEWNGSGVVDGYGRSTATDRFVNRPLQFIAEQGLAVLDMDHLGTGPVAPGLQFPNYDDRITTEKLQVLLKWAIQSGSTPYCAPVFFDTPYKLVPRFVRLIPGSPSISRSPYADWVIGSAADDRVDTGDGDDLVYGGAGDDAIDGGSGTDTAFYVGDGRNFVLSLSAGNLIVTDRTGVEGVDTVTGIEFLQFADARVRVSDALAALGAQ